MNDISNIMSLDIENLKERQRDALKYHCLDVLKDISNCIKNNRFEEAEGFLFFSPSGDCMGLDNTCIDFSYDKESEHPLDIGEVLEKLKSLS